MLVCDESPRFRRRLVVALEASPTIEVMAEADDAETVVTEVQEAAPDVVWLGLRTGNAGVRLTAAIRELVPTARVVVVGDPGDADAKARALRAGAVGVVDRDEASGDAVEATHRVAWGRTWLPPGDLAALGAAYESFGRQAGSLQQHVVPPTLEDDQREVLRRLATGEAVGDVASSLGLAPATVDNLVGDAVARLHQHTRAEAVTYAVGQHFFGDG